MLRSVVAVVFVVLVAGCDQKRGASAPAGQSTARGNGVLEADRRTIHETRPDSGITPVNRIPFALVRGNTDGLEVRSEHGKNTIVRGETKQPHSSLAGRGVERIRRVEDLLVTSDVCVVVVDVSFRGGKNPLHNAAEPSVPLAPTLVDTNGDRYLPVGFAYKDSQWARVRYEPGEPIEAISQLPSLSRSRGDQEMWLIYRVSFGRTVKYVARGNKAVFELNPPMALTIPQGE